MTFAHELGEPRGLAASFLIAYSLGAGCCVRHSTQSAGHSRRASLAGRRIRGSGPAMWLPLYTALSSNLVWRSRQSGDPLSMSSSRGQA